VQPLRALHHCHNLRIAHRDFKLQNILVNVSPSGGPPVLKLTDFGMARKGDVAGMRPATQLVCTLWYRAPEKLLGCRQSEFALDMWSYACVVEEVASGSPLFPAYSEWDCLCRHFQLLGTPTEEVWPGVTRLPHFTPEFPVWKGTGLQAIGAAVPALGADGVDLLSRCLELNPKARLQARGALRHPFFAGLGLQGESWVAYV